MYNYTAVTLLALELFNEFYSQFGAAIAIKSTKTPKKIPFVQRSLKATNNR